MSDLIMLTELSQILKHNCNNPLDWRLYEEHMRKSNAEKTYVRYLGDTKSTFYIDQTEVEIIHDGEYNVKSWKIIGRYWSVWDEEGATTLSEILRMIWTNRFDRVQRGDLYQKRLELCCSTHQIYDIEIENDEYKLAMIDWFSENDE